MQSSPNSSAKRRREKIKKISQNVYASKFFRSLFFYTCILVFFALVTGVTSLFSEHSIRSMFEFKKVAPVWNWHDESYKISIFCLFSTCILILVHVLTRLLALFYSSIARKTFAKSVSKEFKIYQYLLLEDKIRNFVVILLVKWLFGLMFASELASLAKKREESSTNSKDESASSSATGATKKSASQTDSDAGGGGEFGLGEILRVSDHVTHILEILETYPTNLQTLINITFTYSLLMIFHNLIMRVISIKFHTNHFKERIEANDYMLNIFEILKKHARKSKKPAFFANIIPSSEQIQEGNLENSPIHLASPEVVNSFASNNIIKKHSEKVVGSEVERAQQYAANIFDFVCALKASNESSYVLAEDLVGLVSVAEAKKFFPLLTLDHSPNLTRDEFIQAIGNIYQQKHDIINSLCDHSVIIDKIDMIFFVVFVVLCILLALPSLFIILIAFSIVFITILESFLRKMCKSAIFVIVTHPFDIGDYIIVLGERFKVKEIHLLTTVLISVQGEIVYYNNIELAKANIINIRRSPSQKETIVLYILPSTGIEELNALKEKLDEFVKNHSREFEGFVGFSDYELINQQRMQIKIQYTHKANFQDFYLYKQRKTLFQQHLWQLLQTECPIQLAPPNVLLTSDLK